MNKTKHCKGASVFSVPAILFNDRPVGNAFPVAVPFQAVFACQHYEPCVGGRMGHDFPHLSVRASSEECLRDEGA